ncbi:Hypothetical protein AJAP_08445 [Amycolatopsis japonica]|uniref:XRE family transcriptional regulator n=1 Tax=Amycolatopsis japonica TaxID=208439 RepID=A0A075UK92_9PSEU|nr:MULTISPECIES: hypothetical protein [Amycolatopsis]AIG74592.1 Hypothetical protein AJAP_08445 [Amycolatopsis japonica]OKJ91929.1 hypothetical protein AMK34_33515 [Amycolatopsis sp. CB00013]
MTTTGRIGIADVECLENAVDTLRALDYRQGGAFSHDAVHVVKSVSLLLTWGAVPGGLRSRLLTVLADLHNLLGWTEFDIGRRVPARLRFDRALGLAAAAGNDNLMANICYRLGRLALHHDDVEGGLDHLRQGQAAAHRSGSLRAQAILTINEAWALAKAGDERAALTSLARAECEFENAGTWAAPRPWEAFFGATDMAAMRGTVLTELARTVASRHSEEAIERLRDAVDGYGAEMSRSLALTLIMLAQNHALQGDFGEAVRTGDEALDLARGLGSTRTKDRLAPLAALLRGDADPASRDLLARIDRYRAEPAP